MDDDTITIQFNLLETQFISTILRGVVELDDDDASNQARAMAKLIRQKLIDACVLEGKISMDHLPAPEVEEDD